jgi:hypothetical protein
VSRKELPRADMTIKGVHGSAGDEDSSNEDVEDETYIPSPRAPTHRKGKGIAGTSGSGAARDGNEEEESERGDDNDGDEEEIFYVEINPSSYVHMGAPTSMQLRI